MGLFYFRLMPYMNLVQVALSSAYNHPEVKAKGN